MPLIASCHCGTTRIELPHLPHAAKSCNCSYCARTAAVWGYYEEGELRVLGHEGQQTYSPTGMNQHHFCGTCGIQTWGNSPDWASIYNADGTPKEGHTPGSMPTRRIHAVNLRLVDDLDWSAVTVEQMDGRNNW
ncbi:MAG TPA: GFA family protein [Devosia sp.]|jgi:hypothetical protein|nr:GFA family protein [Devosia sp.]